MTLAFEQPALRAIDQALVDFLQRQFPQATTKQCQLAGLISAQLADGHLCLPIEELSHNQHELLSHNPLLSDNGSTPLVIDQGALYLQRYWQLESEISQQINQRLAQRSAANTNIKAYLDVLFSAEEEQALNGETNWQKIACALAARQHFGLITGGPGTGKTTTVVKLLALHQLIAQSQNQSLTIRLAAPTGKAAARLADSISGALARLKNLGVEQAIIDAIPGEAITLHRLLGSQPHTRHYRHNQNNPISADLVVVDEASMIDIDMMSALLKALPSSCVLVLVGDKDQLESVEAGAIMGDLCKQADAIAYQPETLEFLQQAGCNLDNSTNTKNGSALAQATVKLRKSWRAQNAPHILALADAINRSNQTGANQCFTLYPAPALVRANLAELDQDSWIEQHLIKGETGLANLSEKIKNQRPTPDASAEAFCNWASAALKHLSKQQLLSPLRQGPAGVTALNARIKQCLQQHRHLDTTHHENSFVEGEPVLVTENRYDLGVMNGDLGLTLNHPKLGLRVAFADPREKSGSPIRWVLPEHLIDFSQGGYAITVHQSQGSEYENVLLYLPEQDTPVLGKELLYTAVTRASKYFTLLEHDPEIFNLALNRSSTRNTKLAERLRS
ncbi:MAG: exodeoxyribonuclease V subunit alpha [Venatoribacter sp.]